MRFTTSVLAAAATMVATASAACDSASMKGPDGNPTTAPVAGESVKMKSPYTITWNPTTPGPLDILLLAGPTPQTLSVVATVVSGIANNGSFTWNVPDSSTGLAPTVGSGYGFQIVDQLTCTYQFSPNFGIEDPSAATQTYTLVAATTSSNATITPTSSITAFTGTGTGTAKVTSPVLSPTRSLSVPASLRTSATSATGSGAAATTSVSGNFAAPAGVVGWNAGLMMAAGMVGAMML